MFCIHCGAPNPDNAKFCSTCGKPRNAQTPVPVGEPDVVLRTFSSATTGRVTRAPETSTLPPDEGGRWIWPLIITILCLVGITLAVHFLGHASSSEHAVADEATLKWQSNEMDTNEARISAYVATPEFAAYQLEARRLLAKADHLRRYDYSQCEAAIAGGDQEAANGYFFAHTEVGAILGGAVGLFSGSERPSRAQVADDTRQLVSANRKLYGQAGRELADYSIEPESIRKYGQDPAELQALLADASVRMQQASTLLAGGDPINAWLSSAQADLDINAVWFSLFSYRVDTQPQ